MAGGCSDVVRQASSPGSARGTGVGQVSGQVLKLFYRRAYTPVSFIFVLMSVTHFPFPLRNLLRGRGRFACTKSFRARFGLRLRFGGDKPTDAYKNRYEYGTGDANTLNMGGQFDDPIARQVYLERVTKDFREEADDCLKSEFVDWLQGAHEDNRAPQQWESHSRCSSTIVTAAALVCCNACRHAGSCRPRAGRNTTARPGGGSVVRPACRVAAARLPRAAVQRVRRLSRLASLQAPPSIRRTQAASRADGLLAGGHGERGADAGRNLRAHARHP